MKRYKCRCVLAGIRIARPRMPFHSVHCGFERPVFSLRGQGAELDSINQTMDFCWFSFQGAGRTHGGLQLNHINPHPWAEQTVDSTRVCVCTHLQIGPDPLTDPISPSGLTTIAKKKKEKKRDKSGSGAGAGYELKREP